jgi:dienelactone hydrolase
MRAANMPRPGYFGTAGRGLFGWYHAANPAASLDCAVVLCFPLGHETTGVHRAYRHWAERLATAGLAAVRFDYQGTGDSAGDYCGSGPSPEWDGSIDDAIEFARRMSGCSRIALAGMRLGGTFALAAATRRADVDSLILWAADATGRAYLREGRAFTRLMGPTGAASPANGHEQIGGMILSAHAVAELEKLDPLAAGGRFNHDVLVIPREPSANDSAFVSKLTAIGANVERREVAGYTGVMVDAHQATVPGEVIDTTVAWLSQRYTRRPLSASSNRNTDLQSTLSLPAKVQSAQAPVAHERIIEAPVRFGSDDGLFGILTASAGAKRRTGIVLANAGAVYRVGPNGLYAAAAREWASLGYTALRVDIGGLGDSQAPPDGEENHAYPSHAVSDIAAAIEALRAQGVERVVAFGLCSGAHTSFHAALGLSGLAGIMVVNPIVFHWKSSDPLDVSEWMNYVSMRHYAASCRRVSSWKRLLKGEVNVVNVARVAGVRLREIARAKGNAFLRATRRAPNEEENVAAELERIRATGMQVFLLFSHGDPGEDFLTLNYAAEVRRLQKQPGFAMQSLEDADHTFTMVAARRRALSAFTRHLLATHS